MRINRISALIVSVAMTIIAGPTTAAPAPEAAKPVIDLGGVVKFSSASFQRVGGGGPCLSPAFTAAEIARVAGRSGSSSARGVGPAALQVQTVVLHDGRTVPLNQYVKALNAVEIFYNANGVTLRHGVLAAPAVRHGGPPPLARPLPRCLSRDQLTGVAALTPLLHFRLAQPTPLILGYRAQPAPVHLAGVVTMARMPSLVFSPGDRRDPGYVTLDPATSSVNPGPVSAGDRVRPGLLVAAPASFSVARRPLAGLIPVVPKAMGAPTTIDNQICPGKPCTLKLGIDAKLTAMAQDFVNDPGRVIGEKIHCKVLTPPSVPTASGCDMDLFSTEEVHLSSTWAEGVPLDFFLKNYQFPCEILQELSLTTHDEEQKALFRRLYDFDDTSAGTETKETGDVASSFFDGSLNYSNKGIADCVADTGDNGYFGVHFCLGYDTVDTYAKAPGFFISNKAGISTSVKLFGLDFDLIDGSASTVWRQGVAPKDTLTVEQPTTNSTLALKNDVQKFKGPSAYFSIGPVPISIESFATATLSVGDPQATFAYPALKAGDATVGHVGMAVSAGTDVSVGFDAAVDALILKAGVTGVLSLLNDTLTGGISTTIDPDQNKLSVEKTYQINATALSGSLSAFVEVDLLVYDERYEVEILHFDGVSHSVPLTTKTWGPFHALIPETIKADPCPDSGG